MKFNKLCAFKLFLVILLINITLEGNALDVKNQLLLMPYPKKVQANYDSSDSIEVTKTLTYTVGDNCDEKCKEFLSDNFKHTITTGLEKQEGLEDFRLSLFKEIDLPQITPEIKNTIEAVNIILMGTTTQIPIFSEGEVFPPLKIGIDESYTLDINANEIKITAPTVYGARHAFETLLQLIRLFKKQFVISQLPISISDEPRFKWRGLLVDPARNVFTPGIFMRIVDALASTKANILHIHLSDGQTFVFESKEYPELSNKGMYDQTKVLTQDFIKELSAYGAKRGVIVYGEIDIPGHTASWNLGYPGVVADCWDYIVKENKNYGENIPCLNPTYEKTFDIISSVLKEVGLSFGSDYVHVGGDEVRTAAWSESKEYKQIKQYMTEKGITDLKGLEHYFNAYSQDAVVSNGKTPIVYEEVFSNQAVNKNSIVHIWSDIRLLSQAVDKGYKAIYSAGYYFDRQMPLCVSYDKENTCMNTHSMWVWTNRDMYGHDPTKNFTPEQLKNVLGGEGCSWDESCDEQNFFDRVFQRFSAVAERFWSEATLTEPNSHEVRANYFRCLNLRREIFKGTGPLYHSFCDLKEN